jgi:semaphorin 3
MSFSFKKLGISLFSDRGTVQKVVVLPTNNSASGELILEELEVFKV